MNRQKVTISLKSENIVPGIPVILLAAGRSKRFRGVKLLTDCDGKPLLIATLEKIVSLHKGPVFVVLDWFASSLASSIKTFVSEQHLNRITALNLNGRSRSMESSLPAALETLLEIPESKTAFARGALICLSDQPEISGELIHGVIARGMKADNNGWIRTIHTPSEKPGHPVWIGRDLLYSIVENQKKSESVRSILERTSHEKAFFHTPDSGAIMDIDRRSDMINSGSGWISPARLRIAVIGVGDLGTGVAARLFRAGFDVVGMELPKPLAVRRAVALSECVYLESFAVEGVEARVVAEIPDNLENADYHGKFIPVLINHDQSSELLAQLKPDVIIDSSMTKRGDSNFMEMAGLVIGLGPGFNTGKNCHAVVETMRGPLLGRVIWKGEAIPNTGIPGELGGKQSERVLRAPCTGLFHPLHSIGDLVDANQAVAMVTPKNEASGIPTSKKSMTIKSAISGKIRGMLRDGTEVTAGLKVGDVDPRAGYVEEGNISDKALAIGGGVLEALLTFFCGQGIPE
ncbi:MAG: hypothetical protein CVV64_04160 [Candidatus Wallbacteria bacterium HGW-Wallbacteria-1]|jgi:xanthine dehydrogenase accessory factor|uniref:MobA-like NTP transferase domain-containing protein n=1 Tax=Candidatus Wallbacteria bacterium HGW-Wallbacteria-1 TaxID=2013854 RepID=A0A2N1PRJ7_9BACT|nr:MAG: hypothetical protein CVV64_04160 [Candidatus Wallbacteria bacterium HGW-Wallbacteria-1]